MQNRDFEAVIEANVGLSVAEIMAKDSDEIQRHIENQKQCMLVLDDNNETDYRGSMLLAIGEIDYDIDEEFDRTFKIK